MLLLFLSNFKFFYWYRQRKLVEVAGDRDRFKQQLDLSSNDKQNLDRVRSSLAKQVDELTSEVEKLKLANTDLIRTRDHLEDEKDDSGFLSFLCLLIFVS